MRGKRLRKQDAKQLVWFMGCGPVKQIILARKIPPQMLEHSLGTEWEKNCYLRDAIFLTPHCKQQKVVVPFPFRGIAAES